jgi:hypothetical protein
MKHTANYTTSGVLLGTSFMALKRGTSQVYPASSLLLGHSLPEPDHSVCPIKIMVSLHLTHYPAPNTQYLIPNTHYLKILTVDIGTGTQDIFLYDSNLDIENGLKLVVPSPTMIIHQRLKEATRRGRPVLLHGVMMGGGPSAWAAEAHARAGPCLCHPDAARTTQR